MNRLSKSALGVAVATLVTFGGVALPSAAQAQPQIMVRVAPPAPPYQEVIPPPRRGKIWSPGHYEWRGNRYVWVRGHWVNERRGYAYRAPQWVERDGRWVYQRPGWDRDGDGVPNRYDSTPNGGVRPDGDRDRDGVRNRYDRDRDGDGVSNRYDRAPDNPRRH